MAKKNQNNKQKNSTLAIDSETSNRLDIYCQKAGITKKDFVTMALDYFERTGIDPNTNDVQNYMEEINDKLNSIVQLQADAAVKLTGIQERTSLLNQSQENTARLIEQSQAQQKEKKGIFGIFKKK